MDEFEKMESQIEQWGELSAIERMELAIKLIENNHIELLPDGDFKQNVKNGDITCEWLKQAIIYLTIPPAECLSDNWRI